MRHIFAASLLGAVLGVSGCSLTDTPDDSASSPQAMAWAVVVAADDDPNELDDELPEPSPVDKVFREVVPTACYVPTTGDVDLSPKAYIVVLRGETEAAVTEAAEINDVVGSVVPISIRCGA